MADSAEDLPPDQAAAPRPTSAFASPEPPGPEPPGPEPPGPELPGPEASFSEASPPGTWPQYSLKWLLAVMTFVCVLISAAIQFQTAAVLLVPLGLCVLLLVRDRWALTVVGLYALLLLAMAAPLAAIAFQQPLWGAFGIYVTWPFWLWLDVMIIAQAALLVIPVAKQNRRPVRRRSLWLTMLACGLMMGFLALAAVASVHEFATREPLGGAGFWLALAAGLAVWSGWAAVFYIYSRRREPNGIVATQCRLLLSGSILELLIAIPTHIVARSRDYCCAGIMTFLGLVFGISVMLFAFGPGLYFLFLARWRQVRPPPTPPLQ
jgi:hypothetical protein